MVIPVKVELATPGLATTGALPGQRQLPSSPCAGKWDLRGGSPSGQEHVGGHAVKCGHSILDSCGHSMCHSMCQML